MDATENLIPGETVVFRSHKHWIAPARDSLIPVGLLIVAYVVGAIRPDADGGVFGLVGNLLGLIQTILVVVAIGWIVYNVAVWRTASFAVTDLRVLRSEGLIQRRTSETLLSSLSDVRLSVGLVGKQLGYGDVGIMTGSGEGGADMFRSITEPVGFRNAMMEQKMREQGAPKVAASPGSTADRPTAAVDVTATASTTAESPAAEAATTIRHLGELRDQGLITPDEFDAKKAEVLARL